jgi:hypothetical protein
MNDLKVTLRWVPDPEVYTPEETAEFMLNNAVTAAEYDEAMAEIRAKGIDPDTLVHQPRPESRRHLTHADCYPMICSTRPVTIPTAFSSNCVP